MKRGRKPSNEHNGHLKNDATLSNGFVKSTYLLDPVLKENLQYLALAERKEQSDIVREAISSYLVSKGLDPAARPIFVMKAANK